MGVETPDFLKPTSEKLDEYEIRALTNIGIVFIIEIFVAVISLQDSVDTFTQCIGVIFNLDQKLSRLKLPNLITMMQKKSESGKILSVNRVPSKMDFYTIDLR